MTQNACHACQDYERTLSLSRRGFLAASGVAAGAAISLPAWLPRVVYADEFCSDRDVILAIFLRGASDGLTLCVPHFEQRYYTVRPTQSIPQPGSGSPFQCINLGGSGAQGFGFPQPLAPLIPAYNAGHLLVVHATGSTDPTRSHFDAQRFMEVGQANNPTLITGWLGRHLSSVTPLVPSAVLRAVGIGYGLAQCLQGGPKSLAIPNLDDFILGGDQSSAAAREAAILQMYAATTDPLRSAAQTTQATIDLLDAINFAGYQPDGGAVYPTSSFAYAMKTAAALIKSDVGVEAVSIDINDWDTHNAQGSRDGFLASHMGILAGGLGAFHADMFGGANGRNVTVVVMSEFGRRVAENGSLATDHGHGNCMFVMGNNIAGGRVMTQWPGLQPEQLFEGLDLEVTIDYRDILGEIISQRLANGVNLPSIFPGYVPSFQGVTTQCQGVATDGDPKQEPEPTSVIKAGESTGRK